MSKSETIYLDFIQPQADGTVKIEGYTDIAGGSLSGDPLYIVTKHGVSVVTFVERRQREQWADGKLVSDGGAFEASVQLDVRDTISFSRKSDGGDTLRMSTNEFTRLAPMSWAYRLMGPSILRKYPKSIKIVPHSRTRRLLYEFCFFVRLIFYWRLSHALQAVRSMQRRDSLKTKLFLATKPLLIIGETLLYLPRDYVARLVAFYLRASKKKPIWLISDRVMAAGDNGEALFRYIAEQAETKADVRFVLSKKSSDFARLDQIGKVVDSDGLWHKALFLAADKVISSHADIETINPFLRQKNHVIDLYTFDFVFLQHGVTRNDVSSWLNRFNRNIELLVTSAKSEYESFLRLPYYYREENIILTGMPRFDLLENRPAGKVIIAPTYRKQLLRADTDKHGTRPYDNTFKTSEYFQFYQALINEPRLHKLLQQNNMTAEFYLHPTLAAQIDDFTSHTDTVHIQRYPYDYTKAFREADALVTDYSSVMFDFAYLKKPVIYAQFDRAEFYSGHAYVESDFFNDKDDGFGPIETTVDGVIARLEEAVAERGQMSEKYREHVDNFFAYTDKENSRRVYEAIIVE